MKSGIKKVAMWLVLLIIFIMIISAISGNMYKKMTYSDLLKNIKEEKVETIQIEEDNKTASVKIKDDDIEKTVTIPSLDTFIDKISDQLADGKIELSQVEESKFLNILEAFGPTILLMVFIFFIWVMFMNPNSQGGNKTMSFGKSKARMMTPADKNKITFADVAGIEEEKQELEEIVEFLKNPKKFTDMGARIPKGVLLVGHPGTGKTLLAKAVAGEAGVPFFIISGSDFVEMFVGVGAGRVRDMFKKAKENAPCIIFIDEIDAVGRQRGAGFGGGHDEREQTLNQLLVEMDGMEENTGVVVIAATNRPDVLDPALLRAGRFDRQITVSLPDRKGREAILKVHARNKQFAADIDLGALAKRTPGFSGADLENVLNESAIMAVRHNETEITMADIDEAIDRVMMGPAKVSKTYDDKTKKLVAYHESGHAIVGLFMENAQVVQKVTIIPRGQAGGYNLMTPKEEKMMNTKNDLLATITSFMGGRVAEELFFDDVTTGASNDIERATNIAKDMVTLYGMSDLGPIKYNSGSENVFLGRDYNQPNNVSGQVAFEIDQEVRKIVNGCHDEAKKLIQAHETELTRIAEALMEYETLTAEQIQKVVKGEDISADFTDAKVEQSSTDEMNA